MNWLVTAFGSAFCYGIIALILEHQLSKMHGLTIFILNAIITLPVALILRSALMSTADDRAAFAFPALDQIHWSILVALAILGADCFYFAAYNKGADATSMTMVLATVPVFTAIVSGITNWKFPSLWEVAAFVCVCLALFCIAKAKAA